MAQRPRPPPFLVVRRAVVPKRLCSFEPTTESQNWLQSCPDTRCRGEHRPRTDSPSFFDVATRASCAVHPASSCARHLSPAAGPDQLTARAPALFSRSSRCQFFGAAPRSVTDNRHQWLSRASATPTSPRWTTSSARRRRRRRGGRSARTTRRPGSSRAETSSDCSAKQTSAHHKLAAVDWPRIAKVRFASSSSMRVALMSRLPRQGCSLAFCRTCGYRLGASPYFRTQVSEYHRVSVAQWYGR